MANIILNADSTILCRVTPGQKADVVNMIKEKGKRTLAIGDGANDCNMILAANVGVGLFGKEGTRASEVADYSIGEFCLLMEATPVPRQIELHQGQPDDPVLLL